MATKFIPSREQLDYIRKRYLETKNYSQISRETGISPAIIKRLLTEEAPITSDLAAVLSYKGMEPDEPFNRTWNDYNIEAKELHSTMVERNGIL